MSPEICPRSDLPTTQCAHCRADDDQPAPAPTPFVARYHGTCGGCGFDIKPGELTQHVPASTGSTIAHTRCAHGS